MAPVTRMPAEVSSSRVVVIAARSQGRVKVANVLRFFNSSIRGTAAAHGRIQLKSTTTITLNAYLHPISVGGLTQINAGKIAKSMGGKMMPPHSPDEV